MSSELLAELRAFTSILVGYEEVDGALQRFDAIVAKHEKREEKPPEGTVRVRIAVAVDPRGAWNASGDSDFTDWSQADYILDTLQPGEGRHWVCATLPIPAPDAPEVEGEVEHAD